MSLNIGITYDLRSDYLKMGYSLEETAEFDKEDTIEAIENVLNELGYRTEKIGHIKQLAARLLGGEKWDLVFNICEGMYGIAREAQVPALLDAYNIPYVFSSPLVNALTLDKAMTKRVIRDAGIATPDFFVVNTTADIQKINMPFPLFAKPVAEGTGKGITGKSLINNREELSVCEYLLKTFRQPVIVEKFMSGREFTTGVVGTGENARCIGTMEILLRENAEKSVYSYSNKEDYVQKVDYYAATGDEKKKCEDLALAAYRVLSCEDGGRVDIRFDSEGNPNFLEINPLAGLHPVHSDLPLLAKHNGISYPELMKMIMDSAVMKILKK
jgi:D-alanine-D-alanine ligase